MSDFEDEEVEIERGETGVRILYTLLFLVIGRVVESVVIATVAFELLWALVTRQAPPPRVREFANRAISYFYRIGRYLTYNDPAPPFPLADFPPELEPPGTPPELEEGEP
jgi:hypothetical protein